MTNKQNLLTLKKVEKKTDFSVDKRLYNKEKKNVIVQKKIKQKKKTGR